MKEIAAFIAGGFAAAMFFVTGAVKCSPPPKPDETVRPTFITPGNHIIEGRVQVQYMGIGDDMTILVGTIPKGNSVVQLSVKGDSIHVVRDGRQGAGVGP